MLSGFWNVLYDDFLKLRLPQNCKLISFSDDLVLYCWAKEVSLLEIRVNIALGAIVTLGESVKLAFNEMKTQRWSALHTELLNTSA